KNKKTKKQKNKKTKKQKNKKKAIPTSRNLTYTPNFPISKKPTKSTMSFKTTATTARVPLALLATVTFLALVNPTSAPPINFEKRCGSDAIMGKRDGYEEPDLSRHGLLFDFPAFDCGTCKESVGKPQSVTSQFAPNYQQPPSKIELNNENRVYIKLPETAPAITPAPNDQQIPSIPSQPETPIPSQPETPIPSQPETPIPSQPETPLPSQSETPLPSVTDTDTATLPQPTTIPLETQTVVQTQTVFFTQTATLIQPGAQAVIAPTPAPQLIVLSAVPCIVEYPQEVSSVVAPASQ
ncbi:hypothetical protein BC938DRAFT_471065, partial [Jimgerdemannia flammicorona]